MGAPSFASLQQMCSAQPVDYGNDAQGVYATLFDAYVANRRGKLSKDDYCAFQTSIAQRYTSSGHEQRSASAQSVGGVLHRSAGEGD